MPTEDSLQLVLADALRRKEAARVAARALQWPQKVAAIERMREASRIAKEGMRRSLLGQHTADESKNLQVEREVRRPP